MRLYHCRAMANPSSEHSPPPHHQGECEKTLTADCGADKGKGAACDKCVMAHHPDLEKVHCDMQTVEAFCN